jgi:hypothetical protein
VTTVGELAHRAFAEILKRPRTRSNSLDPSGLERGCVSRERERGSPSWVDVVVVKAVHVAYGIAWGIVVYSAYLMCLFNIHN